MTLYKHSDWVRSICYSLDDKKMISCSHDRQIIIWNAENGQIINILNGHTDWVKSIKYSPDNKYIISCSLDKSIKIWGANDFKLNKAVSREKGFESHSSSVNKIVWNGDQLISVSDDKRIIVWEVSFD